MTNEVKIERVKNAIEQKKVISVYFFEDCSGVEFYYLALDGCTYKTSLPMEDAIKLLAGNKLYHC